MKYNTYFRELKRKNEDSFHSLNIITSSLHCEFLYIFLYCTCFKFYYNK